MDLQPGQTTHSAIQLSQAQLLQHHQAGIGAPVRSQQKPEPAQIQQQQQQQHDQVRLPQQQQQHMPAMHAGVTSPLTTLSNAASLVASNQVQIPVIGSQSASNVVSSTQQDLQQHQQQPIRNVTQKKVQPVNVQNAQRMASPMAKSQLNFSQQQLLRQYKHNQMQPQPHHANPRMQMHQQQQFASNKAAMLHQAQMQQGMALQGVGGGVRMNNLNSQKKPPGMQSPPRTAAVVGHGQHGLSHMQAQHMQVSHSQVTQQKAPHQQAQHAQAQHQQAQHQQAQHQQAQHHQTPNAQQGPLPQGHPSPSMPHEHTGPDKGSGDNLAGQTITVEAVEVTPITGQARRLIKLVVSGAKGQAHNILSKNQPLQQQILNMMQKALTSTAEVSFPSDSEMPIKVTCKSNADTNVSASGDNRKPPILSPEPSAHQLANRNSTNAPLRGLSPRSHVGGMGMMAPRQAKLRSPPPMSSTMSQLPQHTPHNSLQARFGKPGKRMTTPEQYVMSILQSEAQAVNALKAKEKKPVGVATQYTQNMPMLQQQLIQGTSPQAAGGLHQRQPQHAQQLQQQHEEQDNEESGLASMMVVAGSMPMQTTKESGSIKVISPAKSGIDNPKQFVAGNDYTIECPNGKRIVGTWDGKYFKVKNPVSDNQAQPGKQKYMHPPKSTTPNKLATSKSSKSSTPKTLAKAPMVTPDGMAIGVPILSMAGPKQLAIRPQLVAAATDDHGVPATVARPESHPIPPALPILGEAADSSTSSLSPTEHIRKRPSIPRQEGKYAVCDNCGNLSFDYETCEGCKRPLPDDPKLFAPNDSGTQLILLPNNTTMGAQQLYTSKLADQAMLQKTGPAILLAGRGRGRGVPAKGRAKTTKGRGRGRGGSMSNEPDTVTILSSDEDGDETRAPAHKLQRLDRGLLMGKKLKMEDETGKVVHKPYIKKGGADIKSPNISATKVTEQKSGGNTVIRMVDPVIQLAAQAVRIGSMQTIPVSNHVEFSLKGFRMMLKLPTESGVGRMVDVRVEAKEIIDIAACFTKFLVLFIRVSLPCAIRIRHRCGMESNSEHYFDPNSSLDCHRHLTILMSQWKQRDQEIFKAVCRKMESDKMCGQPKILNSLVAEKANDMLVQASYVGPQIKKKPTSVTGGQLVSHVASAGVVTTAGLVASQVLINQGGIISQVLHIPGQALPAGHVILTLPTSQTLKTKTSSVDGDEEEEPIDRSRSPSPLLPTFAGPVVRLFTYPPAPITGGIPVTNEDLFCLNEGEFLNDVIIDFYLKYLINEVLTDEDKDRTHVFSSFFYRRLTQKQNKRHMNDDMSNLTAQEKRHSRVKTWTRHVDLFDKDFVIVPINESAHWYLAIICFPGLTSPIIDEDEPEPPPPMSHSAQPSPSLEKDGEDSKQSSEGNNSQGEGPENSEQSSASESNPPPKKAKPGRPKLNRPKPKLRRTVLQPTILIFDSLSGPGRTGVVRTLREYIQVEWNIKKVEIDGERVFTKDNMRGCITKCPQQTNFSDCGVFVLQYVESFFNTPIRDYSAHPMDLNNWFPESCVKQKREELRLLILDLQQELNAELDYDPTQDGCVGTSPSHMVTVPMSMDGSQMQTPVITSIAGGSNAIDQHAGGTPLTALPNVPHPHEDSEHEPPGFTDSEAQNPEPCSHGLESKNGVSRNGELPEVASENALPEQENTVSEGLSSACSQEEGASECPKEHTAAAHTEENGQMDEEMSMAQVDYDEDNAQHLSEMNSDQQQNVLQSEQCLENEHAMDHDESMESIPGHVGTSCENEQLVTEQSDFGQSQGQDGVS